MPLEWPHVLAIASGLAGVFAASWSLVRSVPALLHRRADECEAVSLEALKRIDRVEAGFREHRTGVDGLLEEITNTAEVVERKRRRVAAIDSRNPKVPDEPKTHGDKLHEIRQRAGMA